LTALIIRLGTAGVVIDAVLGCLAVGTIFLRSRRNRITLNAVSEVELAAEVIKLPRKGKSRAAGI
jgi:hypothetical protein